MNTEWKTKSNAYVIDSNHIVEGHLELGNILLS